MDVDPDYESNLPRHQNMFFCKNGKLESLNKKPERLLFTSSRAGQGRAGQGREQDEEICIYYWRCKVVWDAVATLASLSGYMAHVVALH